MASRWNKDLGGRIPSDPTARDTYGWMRAELDLARFPDYKKQCEGKYKDINALVETPEQGHKKLKQVVGEQVLRLPVADRVVAQHIVNDSLDVFAMFQGTQDRVVEMWSLIWAYRNDGTLAWHLKIIADTDFPPTSEQILPHHGFEIYLNNSRVAGPGHIYFTKVGPGCWRTQAQKHEVARGTYYDQAKGGQAGSSKPIENELRLDFATRLWAEGRDEEAWQYCGYSSQAYDRQIQKPWAVWERLAMERPSFGLSKDEL